MKNNKTYFTVLIVVIIAIVAGAIYFLTRPPEDLTKVAGAALEKNDPGLCSKLPEEGTPTIRSKKSCLDEIAKANYNTDACGMYGDTKDADDCYSTIAKTVSK